MTALAICVKIKGKRRSVCLGDLDRCITLLIKEIKSPDDNSFDYDSVLTISKLVVFANIETKKGVTIFDSSNRERNITHFVYIRHTPDVDIDTWVRFNDENYDVVDVENLDERSEFLLLRCAKRGTDTLETNRV